MQEKRANCSGKKIFFLQKHVLPYFSKKRVTKELHFTLIELLVVIAIIAILAGMLLPTLNKARESGRKIACNNKLRTLLTYIQLYGNTYSDFIPLAVGNAEKLNWATYKQEYNGKIYTSGIPSMLERGWQNVVPGKESPYMCPGQNYSKDTSSSLRLSYGWNRNYNTSHIKFYPKLGSIKKPSVVFVLIETRPLAGSARARVWEAIENYPDAYVSGQRHNKSGHIGFFDGHTVSWRGRDPEKAKVALWHD